MFFAVRVFVARAVQLLSAAQRFRIEFFFTPSFSVLRNDLCADLATFRVNRHECRFAKLLKCTSRQKACYLTSIFFHILGLRLVQGKIGRAEVARICVAALSSPAATDKTFEVGWLVGWGSLVRLGERGWSNMCVCVRVWARGMSVMLLSRLRQWKTWGTRMQQWW